MGLTKTIFDPDIFWLSVQLLVLKLDGTSATSGTWGLPDCKTFSTTAPHTNKDIAVQLYDTRFQLMQQNATMTTVSNCRPIATTMRK